METAQMAEMAGGYGAGGVDRRKIINTEPRTLRGASVTVGGNMTRIAEGLQRLDEVISVLEKNIDPILTPQGDDEKSSGEESGMLTNQSPISEQLESFADRIDRRIRHVTGLLSRVNL